MLYQEAEIKHASQVQMAAQDDASDAIETLRAETVEQPPGSDEGIPPSKTYTPLSFPVLALLMPASVFGVLARLGLVALMNYDGHAVFPLAYAQAVGCLVMGFALGLKESIGQMCVLPCLVYMMMISFYITQVWATLHGSYDRCN
jgi:hypothetical protein